MSCTEEDLLPLSALQHLIFCPRQCALIHIEQAWAENLYTAEGRVLHGRADAPGRTSRGSVRIETGVFLRSFALGLVGKADVVEFHRTGKVWRPFPVEYKRGRPKKDNSDKVQLCAQAMCLEEMLGVEIRQGALFYGKQRRRLGVSFDEPLRQETEATAEQLHVLVTAERTPPPKYSRKCDTCSLIELCRPRLIERTPHVERYLDAVVRQQ